MPPREDPATASFWLDAIPGAPGRARLGLTEAFLESLVTEGRELEVVGLELLPEGSQLRSGDSLGLLHLPDRAIDLRVPFALTILARNAAVLADPRLVRTSPYARGWLIEAAALH
jgi:glycine cleavage system H lipoate-binding protein